MAWKRLICLLAFMLFFSFFAIPAHAWWNPSWQYRITVNSSETMNVARISEPVFVNVSILYGHISNCWKEIRVTQCSLENSTSCATETEIPSQVISGDNATWCYVLYPANVSANSWRLFYVYYGNEGATQPTYSTDLSYTISGNDFIVFWNNRTATLKYGTGSSVLWIRDLKVGTVTLDNPTDTFASFKIYDSSAWDTDAPWVLITDGSIMKSWGAKTTKAILNVTFFSGTKYFILKINYTAGTVTNPNDFRLPSQSTPFSDYGLRNSTGIYSWSGTSDNNAHGPLNYSFIYSGSYALIGALNSTTFTYPKLKWDDSLKSSTGYFSFFKYASQGNVPQYTTNVYYYWMVDDFSLSTAMDKYWNQNKYPLLYSVGEEETQAPVITIISPLNQTYFYSTNFLFEFKAHDEDSTQYQIKVYLDGFLIYDNSSYYNNTVIQLHQNLTQAKQYNFTVWANDTDGKASSLSVLFTIKDFEISGTIYEQNPYETESYNFSITFKVNFDLVSNITSELFWNSTNKGQDWQFTNSTHIENRKQLTMPLIQTNATSVDHYWDYNVIYKNGTTYASQTASNSQTILFAYWLDSNAQIQDRTNLIENEDFNNTLTVSFVKNYATLSAVSNYRNSTKEMHQSNYGVFNAVIDSGNVTNYTETYPVYSNLTVSFQGNSRIMNSETDNVNVYKIYLGNCSDGISTTQTLNLIAKDEETKSDLSSFNQTFLQIYAWKTGEITRVYNFTNVQNVCVYPSWAQYSSKIYATVKKDSYYLAEHYPYTTTYLDNSTKSLTLYMLPQDKGSLIKFSLPATDYILIAERKYEGGFVYVRGTKADFNKNAYIYLKPYDEFYRISVYTDDQKICFTSSEFKIAESAYSVTECGLISTIYPTAFYEKNLNATCAYYNSTKIFKCEFYALDNIDHEVRLQVWKNVKPWGKVLVFDQTQKTVSGNFETVLEEGNSYEYVLSASSAVEYLSGIIDTGIVLIKDYGIYLFAIIFFVSIVGVGAFNPFVGFLLSAIFFVVLNVLDIISLKASAFISLILISLMGIIFIYRRRYW